MFVRSADANTSAGAPPWICVTRADDAAGLSVIVVPWFCFWNFAAISANASVSDAASATVMLPESFCCFAAATVAVPPTPTSTVPAITQVATSRRIVPLRLIRMGGTVPGGARLWQPRAWPGPRGRCRSPIGPCSPSSSRSRVTGSRWPGSSRPTRPSARCGPSAARSCTAPSSTSPLDGSIEASRTEPGDAGPAPHGVPRDAHRPGSPHALAR